MECYIVMKENKKTKWIEEKNNIYTKEDYLQNRDSGNYIPKKNSPLVDKGVIIDELKEIPFVGDAPDIGAYEYGKSNWKVGPYSNKETSVQIKVSKE